MRWSADLAAIVFSLARRAPRRGAARLGHAREFASFFGALVERERAQPSGNLLSALVHSEVGTRSAPSSSSARARLLLFGGHETTTNLIDNALGAPARARPSSRTCCACTPSAGTPRSTSSCAWSARRARWRARSRVAHGAPASRSRPARPSFLAIAAANHDPAVFEDPAEVDFEAHAEPAHGLRLGPTLLPGRESSRSSKRASRCRRCSERFPKLRPARPIAPLAGATMGYARRLLHVGLL